MNVSNVQPVPIPASTVDSADSARAALQLILLRKTLDMQRQQAEQINREVEGKGQIIDVRV